MQTCRFGLNSSRARDNFLIAALFLWRNNFFLFGEINFCIVILVYFLVVHDDVFAQLFVVSVRNEAEIEEQITDDFGRRRLLNFGNLWEKKTKIKFWELVTVSICERSVIFLGRDLLEIHARVPNCFVCCFYLWNTGLETGMVTHTPPKNLL